MCTNTTLFKDAQICTCNEEVKYCNGCDNSTESEGCAFEIYDEKGEWIKSEHGEWFCHRDCLHDYLRMEK